MVVFSYTKLYQFGIIFLCMLPNLIYIRILYIFKYDYFFSLQLTSMEQILRQKTLLRVVRHAPERSTEQLATYPTSPHVGTIKLQKILPEAAKRKSLEQTATKLENPGEHGLLSRTNNLLPWKTSSRLHVICLSANV